MKKKKYFHNATLKVKKFRNSVKQKCDKNVMVWHQVQANGGPCRKKEETTHKCKSLFSLPSIFRSNTHTFFSPYANFTDRK